MEATKPDMVILCPPTADHAAWVERIAPYDVHIFVEKPFAGSLEEADGGSLRDYLGYGVTLGTWFKSTR